MALFFDLFKFEHGEYQHFLNLLRVFVWLILTIVRIKVLMIVLALFFFSLKILDFLWLKSRALCERCYFLKDPLYLDTPPMRFHLSYILLFQAHWFCHHSMDYQTRPHLLCKFCIVIRKIWTIFKDNYFSITFLLSIFQYDHQYFTTPFYYCHIPRCLTRLL